VEADEVNWQAYFENTKEVCPWSWRAWQAGQIHIQNWHSQAVVLGKLEARLYIAPKHKPRQLKKIADRLNLKRPDEEWLWSHPKFGHYSTPIAVLIQQDRYRLETIRKALNNTPLR